MMDKSKDSAPYATIEEFKRIFSKIEPLQEKLRSKDSWPAPAGIVIELILFVNDLELSINNVPDTLAFEAKEILFQSAYLNTKIKSEDSFRKNYIDYALTCVAVLLDSIIEKLSIQNNKTIPTIQKNDNNSTNKKESVFIVHGHDNEMKESIARFISNIGLDPIILHEQPSKGRAIIEKFEDYSNVSYAIVLYSPDDKTAEEKNRARQNVVFEHGFFIGKLGRNRVVGINKTDCNMELPSDINGVIYISFDSDWKLSLAKEMKEAGLKVDINNL